MAKPIQTQSQANLAAGAIRTIEVWPVKTNAAFLSRALDDEDFVAGKIDTGFIPERLDQLAEHEEPSNHVLNAAAAWQLRDRARSPEPHSPWSRAHGFRLNAPAAETEVKLAMGDGIYTVDIAPGAHDDDRAALAHQYGAHIVVFERGEAYDFTTPGETAAAHDAGGDGAIASPMPGQVIAVHVKTGDTVKKKQPLAVLEAMKMEHTLTAPFDGTVSEVKVKAGERVSEGVLIVRLTV